MNQIRLPKPEHGDHLKTLYREGIIFLGNGQARVPSKFRVETEPPVGNDDNGSQSVTLYKGTKKYATGTWWHSCYDGGGAYWTFY